MFACSVGNIFDHILNFLMTLYLFVIQENSKKCLVIEGKHSNFLFIQILKSGKNLCVQRTSP